MSAELDRHGGPLSVSVQLRWADTDGYGHVNNVSYVRYIEEARIRLFGLPDRPAIAGESQPPVFTILGRDTFTITAAQRLEYVTELPYHRQSVTAHTWMSRVGSRSADMAFSIRSADGSTEYLKAVTTLVFCDLTTRRPRALTLPERQVLERHLGPAPEFR